MLELNFSQTLGNHTLTLNVDAADLPAQRHHRDFRRVRGGKNFADQCHQRPDAPAAGAGIALKPTAW